MPATTLPTEAQVDEYARLVPLLEAAYKEVAEQNKKKPDESLSPLRVDRTNFIVGPLQPILELVIDAKYLGTFDPDAPPSNSDALFVLGQYVAAVKSFKTEFHFWPREDSSARWVTAENPGTPRHDHR